MKHKMQKKVLERVPDFINLEKGKFMDNVDFEVEIEYGTEDLGECLRNLLNSLKENCDLTKTEVEIANRVL